MYISPFKSLFCRIANPCNTEGWDDISQLTSITIFLFNEGHIRKDREDKTTSEQVRLIAELDEKDKSIIFGLIETMLTKKKFKDFFNKNVAML